MKAKPKPKKYQTRKSKENEDLWAGWEQKKSISWPCTKPGAAKIPTQSLLSACGGEKRGFSPSDVSLLRNFDAFQCSTSSRVSTTC
ncbi:hypothetical protein AVEN_108928-1 [Araneus ventricosus]|uniref:Uncharacterized protein n=1 Tax=Araneus ventricosus TaxID=182803 RepID=A0A4Y2ESX7_ARAVE|nr:hypothetical protein AVEN_108928-1 [Araneus ventricosus]